MDDTQQGKLKQPQRYNSYLIRLWCDEEGQPWRVMVQSVRSDESHTFKDLEELIHFLSKP